MSTTWRTIVTPITLVLLLALLGFGMWWGWRELTRPPAPVKVEPCVVQQAAELKSNQVEVKVYNGGTITGRASQITQQLLNKGFRTLEPANTNEKVTQTTIIGARDDDPSARLVAGFFPNSIVKGDNRTSGIIDVLVGDDFAGFKADAPTTIEVPGGEICIHPSATPTPVS